MAIKKIREIDVLGGKMYVREGLASDVAELLTSKINVVGSPSKNWKYHTGDTFLAVDNGAEYIFEEESNTWHLQA